MTAHIRAHFEGLARGLGRWLVVEAVSRARDEAAGGATYYLRGTFGGHKEAEDWVEANLPHVERFADLWLVAPIPEPAVPWDNNVKSEDPI